MTRNVVDNDGAEDKIRDLAPFRNSRRTLTGGTVAQGAYGELPAGYHADYDTAVYAVRSYDTPIGWVRPDGTKVIPDVGYSPTTGQHQYIVKAAWNMHSWPVRGRELQPSGGGPRRGGWDE